MKGILKEVRRRNITGLQWIASEAWATDRSLWEKFGDLLTGTLGFAIRRADVIPGLEQHLTRLRPSNIYDSAFFAEFWEELFNCRLNGSVNSHSHGDDNYMDRLPCKGTEDLNNVYSSYFDVTQLRVSYNVYKAVYLVAHALQDMSNCLVGQGPFLNGTCADPKNFKPWQLIHYMKRANFSILGEKVSFDKNGDPIAYYDLLNWQRRPDGSLHLEKVIICLIWLLTSPPHANNNSDYYSATIIIECVTGSEVGFCFHSRSLRWMQTMIFAIKEINQRSDLLPQLKLGFHIRDDCYDIPVSLRTSLLLVNGQPERGSRAESVNGSIDTESNTGSNLGCAAVNRTVSPVIIGGAASEVSMPLLRSLGSFQIPLVSYFASCSCLSNQREFPTFMRTMPSDAFQVKALARLVSSFGWTWVGLIGLESDYARSAIQLFLQESVQYGVCAAYTHFYPVTLSQQALDELLDVIQIATSKVIINFSEESDMRRILREVRRRNITGLQWIASEAWATASSLWETFGDLLTGTLGFAIRRADVIPGLEQHLTSLRPSNIYDSAFFAEFWEELFNCRLNGSVNSHSHGDDNYMDRLPCKGTEDLNNVYSPYSDVTQLRVSYNVYKAVYLVAHALQDMSNCIVGQGPFLNGTCADPKNFKPWQLIHYMKHAHFSVLGEKVSFDKNGDPIAYYDLLNWQRRPNGSHCIWKKYPAFGISFALCISCLLAKTVVVLMAFRSTLPGSNVMKWFGPSQQRISALLGTAVQVIICLIWLLTSPPYVNNNSDYFSATIIIECVTGSEVAFCFNSRALRWMQTMIFAIKEINQRSDLLPQLKLGFHICDSCDDIPVSLRTSLLLVSYFASCSCLSNQREFPTFMRTMPSDAFQVRALAQLVGYFGWTWVGVIGLESDYARFAIQLFLQESVQYGVCAAYTHFYPVTLSQQALDELLDIIQMASTKVIINFCSESEMKGILREIRRRNITGLQWIASEAWATASSLWEKFGDLLTGTLGFAIRRADVIPGLEQHLTRLRPSNIYDSAFFAEFWEELFNCRLNGSVNSHSHGDDNYMDRLPCKGMEDLNNVYSPYSDVTQLRVSYNVYKAVYLVAHALQDMSNCIVGQGPFLNGTCADPKNVKPWQLIHYMRDANFSALGEKASRSICSDSCPPGSRIARRKGKPICCYDCVPCAEGEVSNKTDSLECSRCSEDTWSNKARDLCIPKTIEYLSYHELMGIILCVVSVLGALVVLMAFRSTLPGSNVMKWFGPNQQRISALLGTAVQVIICLIWLLTSPPHANNNSDYYSATIIIECVTGSEVGF
ncbi:hypothetical protein L3Q82_004944 [Scortum barcoo]|uniref:Uncharacterized protein n=1 Tax=Scortum barcoo TaxID=214431 RepID=A0ACB8VDM5_9TELE|nr:hypothetical protein L3Q82_004944 [Scortum barcoo]